MKLLITCSLALLFLTKCKSECDHCDNDYKGSISQYQIVNTLNKKVLIKIYSNDITTNLNLNPSDTSNYWNRIIEPAEPVSSFFRVDHFNNRNSFPYDSDSISIIIDNQVQKKFIYDLMNKDINWDISLYNDFSAYEIVKEKDNTNEVLSSSDNTHHFYYIIDSNKINN
ncbi:hypothetical protein EI427_13975 [Flammeovirga pectinis]|uniref:Uncharacterized protein n=1 Tax=Flammeovirga pectinis TaxID=2494373 RepID=A0A3S9P4Z7_9BACT|nr:hypothetical protein [Flammeovirga pectinis]AZQ63306.1 hypothetical protein EI427_13975 [Flammeovirga pectinis]